MERQRFLGMSIGPLTARRLASFRANRRGFWSLWIFLALFLVGVAIHMTSNRHQWHRKYLDYRALAEALRVQFYWNLSGVVESSSVAFANASSMRSAPDVVVLLLDHLQLSSSCRSPQVLTNSFLPNATVIGL